MDPHTTGTPDPPAGEIGITPQMAAHVLHHYGLAGGYVPGAFVAQLLSTIAAADLENRALLYRGFPGYVHACVMVETSAAGAVMLQGIAAREAA